jgi:hypothetical protein
MNTYKVGVNTEKHSQTLMNIHKVWKQITEKNKNQTQGASWDDEFHTCKHMSLWWATTWY